MYDFGRVLGQSAIDAVQSSADQKLRMQQIRSQLEMQKAKMDNDNMAMALNMRVQSFREKQFGYMQERDLVADVLAVKEDDRSERLTNARISLLNAQKDGFALDKGKSNAALENAKNKSVDMSVENNKAKVVEIDQAKRLAEMELQEEQDRWKMNQDDTKIDSLQNLLQRYSQTRDSLQTVNDNLLNSRIQGLGIMQTTPNVPKPLDDF